MKTQMFRPFSTLRWFSTVLCAGCVSVSESSAAEQAGVAFDSFSYTGSEPVTVAAAGGGLHFTGAVVGPHARLAKTN